MRISIDTNVFLQLDKAGIVDIVEKIDKYVVYTTDGVVIELRRKDLERGIEKLLDRNSILIIRNVKIDTRAKYSASGLGESELISIALQSKNDEYEGDIIVTSDKPAIKFMEKSGIRYMDTFDFIVWCHKNGAISREDAISGYDRLYANMFPNNPKNESKRAKFISKLD